MIQSGYESENDADSTDEAIDTSELLAVLAEEYTEDIIAAIGDESVFAREIAERSGASRPTVYRRLNRLESIGAIETTIGESPDGQQRKTFRLLLEDVEVSLVASTFEDESESGGSQSNS